MTQRTLPEFRIALLLTLGCAASRDEVDVAKRTHAPAIDSIAAGELLAHIRFLADDRLEGRGTGTNGCREAADYIASEFVKTGLQPGGDFGSYFQNFIVESGRQVLETTSCMIGDRALKRHEEFQVAQGVGAAKGEGELQFVGFGIHAPALSHDDYQGSDCRGKILVVLGGAPGRAKNEGQFLDTSENGRFAAPRSKIETAFQKGAAGLMMIQNPWELGEKADQLATYFSDRGAGLTFPAVLLTASAGRALLSELGLSLDEMADTLGHGSAIPATTGNIHCALSVDVAPVKAPTSNVIGILRGSGPLKDEAIVLGAHYDHLGRGGSGSMGQAGEIHNGADDNASGTAGLLEIAQACARSEGSWNRTLIFVAFSAEELGLLGSAFYMEHPFVPINHTAAMINLDMIGRSKNDYCAVGCVGSSPRFAELPEHVNERFGLGLKFEISNGSMAVGSSDHQSFLNAKIPSLFLFSGLHEDYHRPTDDVDRINAYGAERLSKLCYALLDEVDRFESKPAFTELPQPTSSSQRPSSSGGDRPWFGSVPAFGAEGDGVLFADVREGSPAQKAGLRGGDRLIEWNGRTIKTLEDFTVMLSAAKVGDKIDVLVERAGERVRAEVVLTLRPDS